MSEEFLKLKNDIESLLLQDNLVSFLLYGSVLTSRNNAYDLDGIIIVKKVDDSLKSLFKLLENKYKKLDFNIYTEDEILSNLSFYTREFKLEYLAKSLCLYGNNILEQEFLKVDNFKYRQSILIRSIEHMQLVRQKYFLSLDPDSVKLVYLKKYLIRICKNILLFKGAYNHTEVNLLEEDEIEKVLAEHEILLSSISLKDLNSAEEYFISIQSLSSVLVKCKEELNYERV